MGYNNDKTEANLKKSINYCAGQINTLTIKRNALNDKAKIDKLQERIDKIRKNKEMYEASLNENN